MTVAGVNTITKYSIFGSNYYFIGTNDALYSYESNFSLRNCVKFEAQGIAVMQLITKDLSTGIVCKGGESANIKQQGEAIGPLTVASYTAAASNC